MIENTLIRRSTRTIVGRLLGGQPVGQREHADDPELDRAEAGGAERDGGQQRPDEGDEERAGDAHRRRPGGPAPGSPARGAGPRSTQMRTVRIASGPGGPPVDREQALLEPVVELERPGPEAGACRGSRGRSCGRGAGTRASTTMTPMPSTATNWISGGKPVRKLQNPASEAHDRDREQVEDPLDEDRAQRPGAGHVGVDLEQEGAVQVAELGRDQAVHESTTGTGSRSRPWSRRACRRPSAGAPSACRGSGTRRRTRGRRRSGAACSRWRRCSRAPRSRR